MAAMTSSEWEEDAESWVRWARTPGHDSYWYYSPLFFEAIVSRPGRETLDVGCGEGRVTRDLVSAGHRATGLDASPTLIRRAAEADRQSRYVVGDATSLPFADAAIDVAVAYNSLMDMEDMPKAVMEIGRVLEPRGKLCFSVTHPVNDAGRFVDHEPEASFVIGGSYFGEGRFDETEERDGLTMRFRGWRHSLQDYTQAFEQAGLLIETLREPAAPEALASERTSYRRWQRIPLFLFGRAVKRP
jgi:SAM-dependent methyltransferase